MNLLSPFKMKKKGSLFLILFYMKLENITNKKKYEKLEKMKISKKMEISRLVPPGTPRPGPWYPSYAPCPPGKFVLFYFVDCYVPLIVTLLLSTNRYN